MMGEIKRYDFVHLGGDFYSVMEEQNGMYVTHEDYAALKDECARLAAKNAVIKKIIDSVTDLDIEPKYHDQGMGCGLEDRNITDRYEAMRYGWDEAMERVYAEVIPNAEEIEQAISTPATDAYLAEIRAQAVEDAKKEIDRYSFGEQDVHAAGLNRAKYILQGVADSIRAAAKGEGVSHE